MIRVTMKWFAIALCIALFCVGLIESAPSSSSSEEAMKFRRRLKREIEEVTNRVDKMGRRTVLKVTMKWFAIALCIALFCVGLIESAPSKTSSELIELSRRIKREVEEVKNRVERAAKKGKGKKDTGVIASGLLYLGSSLSQKSRWDYGGHISLYFHRAFHMIWQGLEGRVYTYIYEHPDWDIWIGGHSLGGALATLAAFFLVHSRLVQPDAVKLMTFGQPRVGDKAFADAFDDEVDYAYRVVHLRDMVPSILRSGYWHQGAEIFYQSGMRPGESILCELPDIDSESAAIRVIFFASSQDGKAPSNHTM
ncbi:triacylglycerol lipase [Ancylostoma ceylanicum]|uniref:Triacylglycerol lipase n=1 Tax=Ancylostoma ceylanicum TaxID=53326 RepID=A0A0D6MD96_9BILA|nr:triacylglycerol lipase [Ancylostoma ceylanicum]